MKKVLVTGGSGDIGQKIVETLILNGYFCFIHYNKNKTRALELKNKFSYKSNIIQADLTNYDECKNLIKKLDRIDILINNASMIYGTKNFLELTEKDVDRTMAINFKSVFFLSQQVIKYMIRNNIQGKIINISSISAKYGGGNTTLHYGCAKAAVECLTKGLAKQYAKYNILINCIQAGFIYTNFHKKIGRTKNEIKKRIELIPLKRPGEPKDIANMVEYLCSDKSDFITGQIFTISGGD